MLNDETVSSSHARLTFNPKDQCVVISDLGSSNGTFLNGARIGANCLAGAGALITEGKSFPDGSLIVGAPARAVRTLDEAAINGIAAAADIYVRRFKQYAKGLKPIG